MTAHLSVNLNAIAYLRNRRDMPWPSVTDIGRIALAAGAHGLTVHPRPDERHIRRSDVPELAALIRGEFPGREFNIEGFPDARFMRLVLEVRPDQVTLVPDEPGQTTSDHGWNVDAHDAFLRETASRLGAAGIRVSVFIDPDPGMAAKAAGTGADRVELYTGPYGATHDDPSAAAQALAAIERTARAARAAGLDVNAGHDLTVANLPPLVARVPRLAEVSIGHAITADALVHGMAGAVRRFLAALGHTVPDAG